MDQKGPSKGSLSHVLASMGYIAIPLGQNIAGQLLISAKINDVDGMFILDTGAGTSVLDTALSDTLKLELKLDEVEFTGGGVGSHGIENVPSYNNKIEIGHFRLDNMTMAVMALGSAWESLAAVGAHEKLFGILGVDLLKAGSAIMEFSTMTLYMKQP